MLPAMMMCQRAPVSSSRSIATPIGSVRTASVVVITSGQWKTTLNSENATSVGRATEASLRVVFHRSGCDSSVGGNRMRGVFLRSYR